MSRRTNSLRIAGGKSHREASGAAEKEPKRSPAANPQNPGERGISRAALASRARRHNRPPLIGERQVHAGQGLTASKIGVLDHMTAVEFADQTKRLESHVAEINRIDATLLAAAKTGTSPPSAEKIFGALGNASIACAEVIETYENRPISANVRTSLFRLHGSITDLAASLKLYVLPRVQPA